MQVSKQKSSLLLILCFLLLLLCIPSVASAQGLTTYEAKLVGAVNDARQDAGLARLTVSPVLSTIASRHAEDMLAKGYFGYRSPSFGTVFQLMDKQGMEYTCAGEALARSYSSTYSYAVQRSWTSSYSTLMKAKYTHIGIAVRGKLHVAIVACMETDAVQPPAPKPDPVPDPPAPPSNPTPPPSNPTPPPGDPAPEPKPEPPSNGVAFNADEVRMLDLVNKERTSRGLSPLAMDAKLVELARMKAKDMINKGYFSHTSPTYGSPFDMMRKYGVTYRYAGENLAGAPTVDSAHTNLMNSSGHRANILSSNYTKVGIGVVSGGPYGKMFVQMFIG